MTQCKCKPGWVCFGDEGHTGPCAAWPTEIPQLPVDDDADLTIECLAMAKDLIRRHMEMNQDADNRFLEFALHWINKGQFAHTPPSGFGGTPPPSLLQRVISMVKH